LCYLENNFVYKAKAARHIIIHNCIFTVLYFIPVYFKGEAEAILAKAKAKSNALTMLAEAITTEVSKDKSKMICGHFYYSVVW
jgi:hypothetical protein